MQILFTLFNPSPYIELPTHVLGWIGWIILFLILIVFLRKVYRPEFNHLKSYLLFFFLLILTLITSLFFAVQLPIESVLPSPGLPIETRPPIVVLLICLPWIIASGSIGSLSAVILAAVSGLLVAFWDTHSIFSPLEYGIVALIFSVLVRQNYRSRIFSLFRQPIFTGFCAVLIIFYVRSISAFFAVNGTFAERIDYALSGSFGITFAGWIEVLIGSLLAEFLYLSRSKIWIRPVSVVPAPFETSIKTRVTFLSVPVIILMVSVLILADWWVAGNAAKKMIQFRLSEMAKIAANSLPYFYEAGQSLIRDISNDLSHKELNEGVKEILSEQIRTTPYFRQLYVYDEKGELIGGYPDFEGLNWTLSDEELSGIKLALNGVPVQMYVSASWDNENTAQVTYIASILEREGEVNGVLLGITDFKTNPFSQPAVMALQTIADSGGEGMIIDEERQILYHTYPGNVMSTYIGYVPLTEEFYDETSPKGTRNYVFYQPIVSRAGGIVLSIPAQQSQQMALDIAIPLFILLLILLVSGFIFLSISFRKITNSLESLASNVSLFAQGKLDHPITITQTSDEVGKLAEAFEWMRKSLHHRLEELNHLLLVSQSVASNLDFWEAVKPIVRAAIQDGAMARIILEQETSLGSDAAKMVGNGIGDASDDFAYLDDQIIDHCKYHDSLVIPNTARDKLLLYESRHKRPGALAAFPLRHENQFYGALWVGYEKPKDFGTDQIRFMSTLAGEAALAAANSRLYTSAEVGRQRLEAVISSTPEPVMVFDKDLHLILLNPVCYEVIGLNQMVKPGLHVDGVINHPQLLQLIKSPMTNRSIYSEIHIQNGRTYYASVSPVVSEGAGLIGKICILRDITHFKELDTMKSEFVATVSHDLRSPLTVMSGYATMIGMVGSLNEQQKGYVEKIKTSVDSMSKLVTNLLDLGRIAGMGLRIENVTIQPVMDEVINTVQPHAIQKKIRLTIDQYPALAEMRVEADRELIKQAILNLVDNAVKYTPMEGSVTIYCKQSPSTLVVEVHDTGIGIAPLDLPHMFEKFYRSGRREAYQQRGTGLGLAIVKSIAERHRGRVWVESQLGKGSVFYFEIPCQQAT